ncbi:NAD(P)-binding protein [Karstenula rhodostoma CBS 690.94]|uniref:NAD(P)-binding protein n=1 Tax=Karstenula rhodostoma CBS 690.94 TaxID=1392251 RepID=A0A9P4UEV9_9PLEO|nr:NAD(P)-binding protein [Karstenula rhodostoma CBS 690.94]
MADYNAPEFKRYAAVHEKPKGAGDSRPTALQIVKDNELEGKLAGKVVLITGCSSGIGIETARAMKATGAHVFATARDLNKGKKALADILEPGKLDLELLDLNSLASVRSFAKSFLSKTNNQLNILINNAGIMAIPEEKTEDGFEKQFGTNHLAHFLLFQLLKPALLSSATPEFHSRVVSVSSLGHRYNNIDLDNIMLENGTYEPNRAYAHSKIGNIYLANEIERRYGSQGLHANSLHPGGIWTGLQDHLDTSAWRASPEINNYMKSGAQGAATTVWSAVGKCWEGKGGKYLDNCQIAPPVPEDAEISASGYAAWAYDEEAEKRLWSMSNKFVGLPEDE